MVGKPARPQGRTRRDLGSVCLHFQKLLTEGNERVTRRGVHLIPTPPTLFKSPESLKCSLSFLPIRMHFPGYPSTVSCNQSISNTVSTSFFDVNQQDYNLKHRERKETHKRIGESLFDKCFIRACECWKSILSSLKAVRPSF